MNILQIVHGFPPESNAGTERYCEAVCAQLQARGHRVTVFSGTGEVAAQATTVMTEQNNIDVTRYYQAEGQDGRTDGYDSEAERALRDVLIAYRPDIAHIHHWHRLTNNLAAICADRDIPVVVTLHDVWTSCPRVHRINREGVFCREPLLTAPCLRCVERTQWQTDREIAAALALRRQIVEMELSSASALIVPSEAHRALLCELLELPEHRVMMLPHGSVRTVATQERRSEPSAFPNRPLQIGHWGYFLYHKGTHLLLEALHRLTDPSAVQVHLIGTAVEQAYGDRLHDLARGLSVQFHGAYQPADLQAFDLDLAVFPSITSESYSFIIDEAMRLGLPVLVADRGALSERIGKAGLTFRAGDAEDLARGLQQILDAPQMLDTMRRSVRPDALFSMEAHVAMLEKIYEDTARTSQPKKGTPAPYLKLLVHAQRQVREREEALANLQLRLMQTETALREQLLRVSELEQEISLLQAQEAALEIRIVELSAEARCYRESLEAIFSSTFWRFTTPIRRLRHPLRTLFG